MRDRVIVIDVGVMTHTAIFSWSATKKLQLSGKMNSSFLPNSDYTYMNMIMNALRKIVVRKNDIVIMACDARNSWRKAFYPIYKENRKEMRDSQELIDWGEHYDRINAINDKLNNATDWHFVKIEGWMTFDDLSNTKEGKKFNIKNNNARRDKAFGIEADDIQAVCCKFFPERDVILVTGDADLDQLAYYENTRLYSMHLKFNNSKGCFKVIEDPIKVIAEKVKKGDISDNIIVDKEKDTAFEAEIREFIIDLINLPDFVEDAIIPILSNIKPKKVIYSDLPFPNSLGKPEKYNKIYMMDKEITWEKAVKAHEKREAKKIKKRKEAYQKRKKKLAEQKQKAFR